MVRVGVCGTTAHSVQCAEALARDDRFSLRWVVAPVPRPVGRQQTLTPAPLASWAEQHNLPVFLIEKKLSEQKELLLRAEPIEYLLVVDFGFIVPQWLIDLPSICPINVHPSALPAYRGSSPGQFVLLFGESQSAVTIMRLTAGLDAGPIIAQLPLALSTTETQTSYYEKAFELASGALAESLIQYSRTRQETAQPEDSPTPIARRLTREDGFLPLESILAATTQPHLPAPHTLNSLFAQVVNKTHPTHGELLDRAVRALSPWPGVWTTIPEYKEQTAVRLKILDYNPLSATITRWQFAGETPQTGTLHL